MRSQANLVSSFNCCGLLLPASHLEIILKFICNYDCAGESDEEDGDGWYVKSEYATDHRRAMETYEIVADIWKKASDFMLESGEHMHSAHIGKSDDLHLFQLVAESKVSSTYMCPHALLCHCGAGIRVTENKRKVILEFKGTHDRKSHRIMHAARCAPDIGGIKCVMSNNCDAENSAMFEAFERVRAEIPYSPVLQELRRKGTVECQYRRDLNGISDSDSNSDTCPEQHYPASEIARWDMLHERLNSGKPYVSPSSQEEPEVEYATEYYSESPVRPSLSPATKKREHDEREAEMDAMSSMSESELQAEVQAIMDARERKKQEETRKFLEYRCSLKGAEESQFRRGSYLTLPPHVQPPAATLPSSATLRSSSLRPRPQTTSHRSW